MGDLIPTPVEGPAPFPSPPAHYTLLRCKPLSDRKLLLPTSLRFLPLSLLKRWVLLVPSSNKRVPESLHTLAWNSYRCEGY